MILAVIDTNVIVSALISPFGNEALLLAAVQAGIVAPCLSQPIMEEYAGVLARPRFGFRPAQIAGLIALLRSHAHVVDPPALGRRSPDAGDDMFIACAIASGARYLVTGNKRHFPDSRYGSAQVVSAGELLPLLPPRNRE